MCESNYCPYKVRDSVFGESDFPSRGEDAAVVVVACCGGDEGGGDELAKRSRVLPLRCLVHVVYPVDAA
jgi:hypothetical protein